MKEEVENSDEHGYPKNQEPVESHKETRICSN